MPERRGADAAIDFSALKYAVSDDFMIAHPDLAAERPLEVVPSDVRMRFLYYVSDLPLLRSANLSSRLFAAEDIPPLYGITRQIIHDIFTQENKDQ